MNQYLIIARDGSDNEAQDRRKTVRPAHLAGAKKLKSLNQLITGGAILDEHKNMCGSVMIVQFENDEAFKEWYDNEPYITNGVWKNIEVKPFRVAEV